MRDTCIYVFSTAETWGPPCWTPFVAI